MGFCEPNASSQYIMEIQPLMSSKKQGKRKNKNATKKTPPNTMVVPVYAQPRVRRNKAIVRQIAQSVNITMEQFQALTLKAEHMPSTPAGLAWLRAVLNPCGEDPLPELCGIPDGTGTDAVMPRPRDDLLITPPR